MKNISSLLSGIYKINSNSNTYTLTMKKDKVVLEDLIKLSDIINRSDNKDDKEIVYLIEKLCSANETIMTLFKNFNHHKLFKNLTPTDCAKYIIESFEESINDYVQKQKSIEMLNISKGDTGYFSALPDELIEAVTSKLSTKDYKNFLITNRGLYRILGANRTLFLYPEDFSEKKFKELISFLNGVIKPSISAIEISPPKYFKDSKLEFTNEQFEILCNNLKKTELKKLSITRMKNYTINLFPISEFKDTLTVFNFKSNYLNSLAGIEKLTNLTELNLTCNNLKDVESLQNIGSCSRLTKLNLTGSELEQEQLIRCLKNLYEITDLNLSSNYLTDLTPLQHLVNTLKILNVSSINLNSLAGIKKFKNLIKLNLSFITLNDIESVSEIGNCTELTILKFAWNNANQQQLTESLKLLNKITYIDLSSNNLIDLIPLQHFANTLTTLIIRNDNTKLKSLAGIGKFKNLIKLDLSSSIDLNDVESLSEIGNCTGLTILKLAWNRRHQQQLAECVKSLHEITDLDLSGNYLTDLTPLQHLVNTLKTLDASSTKLKSLAGIEKFQNLIELNLSYNDLRDVESLQNIGSCTRLTKVYIGGSMLSEEQLKFLKSLPPNMVIINN